MKFRLLGVVFVLIGLVATWFWVLGPLREAQAQAPSVEYDMRSFMLAPGATIIGILLIGWGEKVWSLVHGAPETPKDWGYRIALVAVVGGLAWLSWMWFEGQMSALGYVSA